MKKFMANFFATTGISLLLLAIVALLFHAECLYLRTVFQVFGANVIVHTGLYFIRRAELKYAMVEMILEVLFIIFMLLIFGEVFQWFTSTPAWTLTIMGVVIYVASISLDLLYMRQEAREINILIKKHNGKETGQTEILFKGEA